MDRIACVRCKTTGAGLPKAPMAGELGERIRASTCARCWKEWLDAQVILINERQLSGADPAHVDYLMTEMKSFLGIS